MPEPILQHRNDIPAVMVANPRTKTKKSEEGRTGGMLHDTAIFPDLGKSEKRQLLFIFPRFCHATQLSPSTAWRMRNDRLRTCKVPSVMGNIPTLDTREKPVRRRFADKKSSNSFQAASFSTEMGFAAFLERLRGSTSESRSEICHSAHWKARESEEIPSAE